MKIHFDECSQISHINLMRPLDLIATFGGFVPKQDQHYQ